MRVSLAMMVRTLMETTLKMPGNLFNLSLFVFDVKSGKRHLNIFVMFLNECTLKIFNKVMYM